MNKKKENFKDYLDAINKKDDEVNLNEWKNKRKDDLKNKIMKRQMDLNNTIEKKLAFSNFKDFV